MSYRFMRVLVFFDLPVITPKERKEYRKFRTYLLKSGFLMLQESVYCKLALNGSNVKSIMSGLRKNKPPEGYVEVLTITEKQFSNMEVLTGSYNSEMIDTDERLIII